MRLEFGDPVMTGYFCFVAVVLGAVFGSFINCAAWRIAHGENFLTGRSHCAECNHPLGALDLIPVVSYVALKGRCRYCGKKISPRYMLTELLLAAIFAAFTLRYGVSGETLRYMGFAVVLLGLSLVDLETYRIPNGFILAGIIWWAITIPLTLGSPSSEGGLPVALGTAPLAGLIGGLAVGGGMLLFSLLFDHILGKESMGGGDIKLYFMAGLYLGLAVSFFNLILSCIIGILFSAAMRQKRIPFGPSISAAACISLLVGPAVITWYTGLF